MFPQNKITNIMFIAFTFLKAFRVQEVRCSYDLYHILKCGGVPKVHEWNILASCVKKGKTVKYLLILIIIIEFLIKKYLIAEPF